MQNRTKVRAKEAPARQRKKPEVTLRSTSGAGFDFEDLVSAWLMVKMLAGEPTPCTGGDGSRLQAQVSAAGWQIDDLLVTSQHAVGSGSQSRQRETFKSVRQDCQSTSLSVLGRNGVIRLAPWIVSKITWCW
jgi:hypothetical protein